MEPAATLLAASSTTGPAYDIVLLVHILTAFIGFGAVAAAGVNALLLRRSGTPSDTVLRYYRPGTNWAGRVLFAVPVLGVVLVEMSHGSFGYGDSWIMIGFILWVVAAMASEMVLWPAERQLQRLVADQAGDDDRRRSITLQVAATSGVLMVVFVVAMVVMIGRPH
jgi:uncharacterized membrane protein